MLMPVLVSVSLPPSLSPSPPPFRPPAPCLLLAPICVLFLHAQGRAGVPYVSEFLFVNTHVYT